MATIEIREGRATLRLTRGERATVSKFNTLLNELCHPSCPIAKRAQNTRTEFVELCRAFEAVDKLQRTPEPAADSDSTDKAAQEPAA